MSAVSKLSAAAVAATLAFAVPAVAQPTFTGTTTGCFFTGPSATPPTNTLPATCTSNVLGGLTFTGGTFSEEASPLGFVGLGSAPGGTNNLGSATLTNTNFVYSGNRFALRVTFTAPAGTSPSSTIFFADLLGEVTTTSTGGIRFDFDQTPMMFTYTGGTFTLVVDDQSVSPGGTVAFSGFIRTSVIPEPSTYLLMASGLAGLGFAGYRRRRNG